MSVKILPYNSAERDVLGDSFSVVAFVPLTDGVVQLEEGYGYSTSSSDSSSSSVSSETS